MVLLARAQRHLKSMAQEAAGLECATAERSPAVDVCWFPWNRIDWDPRCPAVVTIHDVASFWDGAPADRADRQRLSRTAERAARIVTVSEFSRGEIARHLGVAEERVAVVPEGVDPAFRPGPRSDGFVARTTGGAPYLLFVGNREPRKNLDGLLRAMELLVKEFPHSLVLTGDPPEGPGLVARLRGQPPEVPAAVRERLVWAGRPSDEYLAELYRHADCFVMPSHYEGFGLPLLEAMACGAPVAAARASALPEVGGDVPRWFDPSDPAAMARSIASVLEDPGAMREAGPKQAARFLWEETARQVAAVLEQAATA